MKRTLYFIATVIGAGLLARRISQHTKEVILRDAVAIVTGASSGIGKATAHALAAQQMRLALIARTENDLHKVRRELEIYGIETLIIPADVTDDQESQTAVEQVVKQFGQVDVLINSAGLFVGGALEKADTNDLRNEIAVNLYGSIRMTQCVLPVMLKQRSGHIVNISSVAGRIPAPGEAVYSATKAGLIAFGDALRRELSGTGIQITSVLPSWTDTPMIHNVDEEKMQQAGFINPLLSIKAPDEVALAIIHALHHPHNTVLPNSFPIRLGYLLSGIAPQLFDQYFRLFFKREEALAALEAMNP